MRGVGMVLLALGIVLLIPAGFAVAGAKGFDEALGFLACAAAIPVPMIVAGVALIRRAEDRPAANALTGLTAEEPADCPAAPAGPILSRVGAFDLNRLNRVGWLLLLATIAFVLAEAWVVAWLVGNGPWGNGGPPRVIGLPLFLLALGFFAGLRWLLRLLGVSTYRR